MRSVDHPNRAGHTTALALLFLAIAPLACSPPPTRAWSLGIEAVKPEDIAAARAAVTRLKGELGPNGWTPGGSGSQTFRNGDAPPVTSNETSSTWRGGTYGLKNVEVQIREHDEVVEGPEVFVGISAPTGSPDAENRFRLLVDHVSSLFRRSSAPH